MGAYSYIRETIQEGYKERPEWFRLKLQEWRKQPSVVRIERPTNLPRARSLGYKAKQGIFVVRVRIRKGNRKRPDPKAGRKARSNFRYISPRVSLQVMAEQRAARKHRNAEVINSYYVGEDGKYKYFEVIMADRNAPTLDEHTKKTVSRRGRAFRGLTSAGRKMRGLRVKGLKRQRRRSRKKERKNAHRKK
jgi:large subunit ribosomal protein L15e